MNFGASWKKVVKSCEFYSLLKCHEKNPCKGIYLSNSIAKVIGKLNFGRDRHFTVIDGTKTTIRVVSPAYLLTAIFANAHHRRARISPVPVMLQNLFVTRALMDRFLFCFQFSNVQNRLCYYSSRTLHFKPFSWNKLQIKVFCV